MMKKLKAKIHIKQVLCGTIRRAKGSSSGGGGGGHTAQTGLYLYAMNKGEPIYASLYEEE